MASLAQLFNAPITIEFEGKPYVVRQATLIDQGEIQRWLEQRAYDAIERRTYQNPEQQERDRNSLTQDIAAGVYEWGSEMFAKTFNNRAFWREVTWLLTRHQKVTREEAARLFDANQNRIIAHATEQVLTDPKDRAALRDKLGMPPAPASGTSSSPSATHLSTTESTTSEASPKTS